MRTPPAPPPVTPDALRIDEALQRSPALERLRERLRESQRRFESIRPLLPESLAAHCSPGPLDDAGWSLLAANSAVAAKLRQLRPRLETTLRDHGWQGAHVRVKIRSG